MRTNFLVLLFLSLLSTSSFAQTQNEQTAEEATLTAPAFDDLMAQRQAAILAVEGQWDEAINRLDSALTAEPNAPYLLISKAFVYQSKGDKEEAAKWFEIFLAQNEREIQEGATDHTYFYNRAIAECFLGRREEAYEKLLANKQYFENLFENKEFNDKIVNYFFNLIKDFDEEKVLYITFLQDGHLYDGYKNQ